jgi:hypothetical protein
MCLENLPEKVNLLLQQKTTSLDESGKLFYRGLLDTFLVIRWLSKGYVAEEFLQEIVMLCLMKS